MSNTNSTEPKPKTDAIFHALVVGKDKCCAHNAKARREKYHYSGHSSDNPIYDCQGCPFAAARVELNALNGTPVHTARRPSPKFPVGSWVCPFEDRPKSTARVVQILARCYDVGLGQWLYTTEIGTQESESRFRKASPRQLLRESRRQREQIA